MCWCDSTGLKIYGAGQWLEEKHGAKSRRGWRKLHLAVDADSGEITAHSLTDQEAGDASQLEPLLDQIEDEINQFTADGAYDGTAEARLVLAHHLTVKHLEHLWPRTLNDSYPGQQSRPEVQRQNWT